RSVEALTARPSPIAYPRRVLCERFHRLPLVLARANRRVPMYVPQTSRSSMSLRYRAWVLTGTLTLLPTLSCKEQPKPAEADAGVSGAGAAKRFKIAVIPKGTTHEFWKSVHAGAAKASKELDVEIVWKGPLKEDDLKAQIDV